MTFWMKRFCKVYERVIGKVVVHAQVVISGLYRADKLTRALWPLLSYCNHGNILIWCNAPEECSCFKTSGYSGNRTVQVKGFGLDCCNGWLYSVLHILTLFIHKGDRTRLNLLNFSSWRFYGTRWTVGTWVLVQ